MPTPKALSLTQEWPKVTLVVAGPRQRAGLEAQGARRTEYLGLRGLNPVAGRHHTGLG